MNTEKYSRYFAAVYVALLFCAQVPIAFAETSITTCTELQAMMDNLDEDYVLANDIDCSGFDPNDDDKGFVPVGSSTAPFSGSFNGNGHTISQLTIARPDEEYVGLFGYVNGDDDPNTFQDVTITGSIEGLNMIGALIGAAVGNEIRIDNVTSSVSVNAHGYTVGGILGQSEAATTTVSDTHGSGDIGVTGATADISNIGGLIGYIYYNGSVSDSGASGDVTVSTTGSVGGVGGLVGYMVVDAFSDNSASGDVTVHADAANSIGGLVGAIDSAGPRATILRSHATGDVTIDAAGINQGAGGLVGAASDPLDISLSYTTGNIDLNLADYLGYGAGGIIGYYLGGGDIDTSYSTGRMTVTAGVTQHGVGGIWGYNGADVSLTNSFSARTIVVTADEDYVAGVGGLLGWDEGYAVTIENSYVAGDITAHAVTVTGDVGGLAGHVGNDGSRISNSFYSGRIRATSESDEEGGVVNIGAMVGGLDTSNDDVFSNVFWDANVSGQGSCSSFTDANPSGCTPINKRSYFTGNYDNPPLSAWDFDDTWEVVIGNYPNLRSLPAVNGRIDPIATSGRKKGGQRRFVPDSRPLVTVSVETPVQQTIPTSIAQDVPEFDLHTGMIGAEVRWLQEFLITEGIGAAAAALKAHGTTDFFGLLTQAALVEWQRAHVIVPAAGYFGPITRDMVKSK